MKTVNQVGRPAMRSLHISKPHALASNFVLGQSTTSERINFNFKHPWRKRLME